MRQYAFLLAVSIILVSVLGILLLNVVNQALDYMSPTCLELIHKETNPERSISDICKHARNSRS